jgi:hypothetical protein
MVSKCQRNNWRPLSCMCYLSNSHCINFGTPFCTCISIVSLHYGQPSKVCKVLLTIGIVRTIACGDWVYITSTDDHVTHDVAMILYLLCTLPWQLNVLYTSPHINLKRHRLFTMLFFGTLPPIIYFFSPTQGVPHTRR